MATGSIERRRQQMDALHANGEVDEEGEPRFPVVFPGSFLAIHCPLCCLSSAIEALEEWLEVETDLMTYVVDSIGYLIKIHKAALFPTLMSKVKPFFAPLLGEEVPSTLRHNAICVYDDMIEWCGEAAGPLVGAFALAWLGFSRSNAFSLTAVFGQMRYTVTW